MLKRRILATGFITALFILIADQVSKALLLPLLTEPWRQIPVTSFFNLTPVWNHGVSFGLFKADSTAHVWALIGVALALVSLVTWWLFKSPDRLHALCYGAIIGGALGNIIDRLRFGAVFDFLDFYLATWHYPAFNIADSAIVCGVCWLLVLTLRGPSGHKK
ncbi:MAG: signal peptidase II [Holosporales bacterium]|jgi:signal peptidase II